MLDIQRVHAETLREPRYPRRGWIGVDLDGTLAKCESIPDPLAIGPPVPLMHKRVRHWVNTGREVKIFTARAGDMSQCRLVQQWCAIHGLPDLEITDRKDHRMVALWDDRAVGVVFNMGVPILPAPLTLWQRLRLRLALFFGGSALMKVNDVHLSGHVGAARDASRAFLEL